MDTLIQGMEWFHKGGPVMYLLLACSLLVLTIVVERFLYFRSAAAKSGDLLVHVESVLAARDWNKFSALCSRNDSVISTFLLHGGEWLQRGDACRESMLESEAAFLVNKLKENLNHLETIVTLSPLVGLLGTVIGMINSFSVMNLKNGQPLAITGGVGEALIATATGLCVAIIAMVAHSYFNHRVNAVISEMEEASLLLLQQGR